MRYFVNMMVIFDGFFKVPYYMYNTIKATAKHLTRAVTLIWLISLLYFPFSYVSRDDVIILFKEMKII